MHEAFLDLGVSFIPYSARQAEVAAQLWSRTRSFGLSPADRACLALAMDASLPVMTAGRTWAGLEIDLEIRWLR